MAGLDWDTDHGWSERPLESALLPRAATLQSLVEPDWSRIHRELDRRGNPVAGVRRCKSNGCT